MGSQNYGCEPEGTALLENSLTLTPRHETTEILDLDATEIGQIGKQIVDVEKCSFYQLFEYRVPFAFRTFIGDTALSIDCIPFVFEWLGKCNILSKRIWTDVKPLITAAIDEESEGIVLAVNATAVKREPVEEMEEFDAIVQGQRAERGCKRECQSDVSEVKREVKSEPTVRKIKKDNLGNSIKIKVEGGGGG